MNELPKIFDNNGNKAVSARELHAFLESNQEFANWIKGRVAKYGFIENHDYEVFDNFVKNPSGGRPLTEYALSISCAKEIAMVEGNAKGKQARQYFIACEDEFKKSKNSDRTIDFYRWVSDSLCMNDNSRIIMFRNVANICGIDSSALPEYSQSIGVLIPLSKILEGTPFSARKANPILEQKGVLVKKSRKKSKGGGQKYFWNINQEYKYLGENQVSINNPNETQPMWFEDKKQDIINLIYN